MVQHLKGSDAGWRLIQEYPFLGSGGTQFVDAAMRVIINGLTLLANNGNGVLNGMFSIDPADEAVTGLTTEYKLDLEYAVNDAALGVNITLSLWKVLTSTGAGQNVRNATFSEVAGSQATLVAPAANSFGRVRSGAFVPTAGVYVFGMYASGVGATVASTISGNARLRARNL